MAVNQRPRYNRTRSRLDQEPAEIIPLAVDGALPIDRDRVYQITKGSAAAISVAAPGDKNIGRRILVMGGTDFAHVITFTGGTLRDGTTGASTTSTFPAFQGASIEFIAVSATGWQVIANNLTTIA